MRLFRADVEIRNHSSDALCFTWRKERKGAREVGPKQVCEVSRTFLPLGNNNLFGGL